MGHIPRKLHRFLTSSFRDYVWTDTQTETQMPPKTIPACSMCAGKDTFVLRPYCNNDGAL